MSDPERICGASTSGGGYCQNPVGDCPHHDPPAAGVDVETAIEAIQDAYRQVETRNRAHKAPFARSELNRALVALGGDSLPEGEG